MAPDKQPKKRSLWGMLGLALFGCVLVLMVAGYINSRNGGGTAAPTAERAATSAPTWTAEPLPTATTEIKPSETPVTAVEPTATEPTSVDSPVDEQTYKDAVTPILKAMGAALSGVQQQLEKWVARPALLEDAGWKADTQASIDGVRGVVDDLRGLTAPARFEPTHGQLLLASDHYENAMNLLEQALAELDVKKLDRAVDAMGLGNDFVKRAQELWEGETGAASQPVAPTAVSGPTAAKNGNVRAGPGTGFAVVGSVVQGSALKVTGRNEAGDWFQLADGGWIAAFLVANPPGAVPVAAVIPTEPTQPPVSASRAGTVAQPNAFTCVGGCAVAPDPSCAIKGNVNSDGERIYHEPGWRDYKKTNVRPEEGDRWFCTADEARASGFRAAQQ